MLTDERIREFALGVSLPYGKITFARAVEAEVRKEQAEKIAELTDALQFVERWAVHHGSKSSTSAESALGVIQHYPPIAAITASYADGKTPDTFNPFAKIAELERQLAEARQAVREAVPDAIRKEAGVLAGILSGMCEGGYTELDTLYTEDQADGDAFVKRAAEVLAMIAAEKEAK